MKKYVVYAAILGATLLMSGCKHEKIPPDVMDEAAMVSFLNDAYMLESFYAIESNFNYGSLMGEIAAAYDSLLAEHNVTRADFERSIAYYSRHADRYERIHRQVVSHLDTIK